MNIEELKRLAESGDTQAMVDLGTQYTNEGQYNEGGEWFEKAAQAGSLEGMQKAAAYRTVSAEFYLGQHMWEDAIDEASKAYEWSKTCAEQFIGEEVNSRKAMQDNLFQMGFARYALKDYSEGISLLQDADTTELKALKGLLLECVDKKCEEAYNLLTALENDREYFISEKGGSRETAFTKEVALLASYYGTGATFVSKNPTKARALITKALHSVTDDNNKQFLQGERNQYGTTTVEEETLENEKLSSGSNPSGEGSWLNLKTLLIAIAVVGIIVVALVVSKQKNTDAYIEDLPDEPVVTDVVDAADDESVPHNLQQINVMSHGNTAILTLSEYQDGGWTEVMSIDAQIGNNGISYDKRDGDKCTPAGTFNILYYISTESLNTGLNYIEIDDGDIWVCDPESRYYNTMQDSDLSSADWDSSLNENLFNKFESGYSVACIMFDYNGDGLTAGDAYSNRGSDIFIDGVGPKGNISSGYGDIKISASDMYRLLSCLDSSKNPILIVE